MEVTYEQILLLMKKLIDETLEKYIDDNNKYDTREKGIYVVQCQNFYKIGVAFDPESRTKELQIGNPFPIILIKFFENVFHPFECEWEIHQKLNKYHHHGEWFKCHDKKIIFNTIIKCIKNEVEKYKGIKKMCGNCGKFFITKNNNQYRCDNCIPSS